MSRLKTFIQIYAFFRHCPSVRVPNLCQIGIHIIALAKQLLQICLCQIRIELLLYFWNTLEWIVDA